MAVPKKRTSKAKKNKRKYQWRKQPVEQMDKWVFLFDLQNLKKNQRPRNKKKDVEKGEGRDLGFS